MNVESFVDQRGAYQNIGTLVATCLRASTGSARTARGTTDANPTPFALSLSKGERQGYGRLSPTLQRN
jgi:hypothetical protein